MMSKDVVKPVTKESGATLTDRGKEIVVAMQEMTTKDGESFKSREIAEHMFTSARSVSGAMRKLVNDGFVHKGSESPINYSLTKQGIDCQ